MIGTLLLLTLFLEAGCQEKKTPYPDHPGGKIYQGKMRMDIKCHGCHGWLGEGGRHAPPLVKSGRTLSYKAFSSAVIYGRAGIMPAYNKMLSEGEIRQMMEWLELASRVRVTE